ncbi:hypothetical protein DRE_01884 [Drechslerella stenobrocha 248]|uniref:Cytochrome P450 n=1 Tax=Drechslerella stenobrocha 248 TaxID=1043628 RepID=W7I9A4_9PEZI|nr:hypothetical protein DRE_01884 [Drechslerella stenobrocha 248]
MGLLSEIILGFLEPTWVNFLILIAILIIHKEVQFHKKKVNVPIVGVPFPGYIGAWIGALYFVANGHTVIKKAYQSAKYEVFQVAMIERMLVVVTTKDLINEVCTADPGRLSFLQTIDSDFQVSYTMSREVHSHIWHVPMIQDKLTKKAMKSLALMQDELINACAYALGHVKGETVQVNGMETFLDILTRISNRYFVGKPLCRNLEYINTAKEYAKDVAICGVLIRIWPDWLKSSASWLCSKIPKNQMIAMKHLEPTINQRRDRMELIGKKWTDKPDDYLQWLIEGAIKNFGTADNTRDLMLRLMFLNFAGNHTSAETFCMAFFQLINRPEYIQPLREEATEMIEKHGYNSEAFSMMSKLDSFLRECTRFVSLGPIIVTRTAMDSYSLGNGTVLPVGTQVCMPHHAVHNDPNIPLYANPEFDGFRFHRVRDDLLAKNPNDPQAHKAELWTSTSTHQLFFGNGRHPCPGRFFASLQAKVVLHYILTNYEITADPKSGYEPHRYQTMYIPNLHAKVNFKRTTDPEPGVKEEVAFDLS